MPTHEQSNAHPATGTMYMTEMLRKAKQQNTTHSGQNSHMTLSPQLMYTYMYDTLNSTHLVEIGNDVLISPEVSEYKLPHNGRELVTSLTPFNYTPKVASVDKN